VSAVQHFPVPSSGQNRWRVPVDRSSNQQPEPPDLQQQQRYLDLYQLYEVAVAAGGLSADGTPLAIWCHMASRGVAGVPAAHISGVALQRVSHLTSECVGL
jgi:hypothetical protein